MEKSTDMYFWGHNCGLLFYGLSLKIFQMHIRNKTIQESEHIFQPTPVWQLWAHHACYIGLAALWPEVFAIWLVAYIIKMSHPSCSKVIAIKFCTWHNSCTVVACAKFWRDMIAYNEVTLKPIFHQIWITIGKLFVKQIPGYDQKHHCWVNWFLECQWSHWGNWAISVLSLKYPWNKSI